MPRKKELSYETEKYPFPSRLRKLMEASKTTQRELAQAIGMRPQTVSLYVQGQSFPDVNGITKIARFFSVSSDYLLGLSETATIDEDIQVACRTTGLSQKAIEKLKECPKFHAWKLKNGKQTPTYTAVQVLNILIESAQLKTFGSALAAVLQYSDSSLFNSAPVDVSQDEIDRVLDFLEEKGRSTIEREKLAELELQLACDTLKEIFRMKGEVNNGQH